MFYGNSKYNWIFSIALIGSGYFFIFLTQFELDILWWSYIIIAYVIVFLFSFTYFPLREYKKHQGPCEGNQFVFGPVVYLNTTTRDKLFGFEKQVEEYQFDWENKHLKLLKSSTLYLRTMRQILRNVSKESREQTQKYKETPDVKSILQGSEIDPSKSPLEQIASAVSIVSKDKIKITAKECAETINQNVSSKEDVENKKQIDETKSDRDALIKELALHEPIIYPKGTEEEEDSEDQSKPEISTPELIKLSDLGLPKEEQINLLKESYYYLTNLYHPEILEGYDFLEFEQVFFILPGPINEVLATTKLTAFDYDGYPVKVQGCSVMMCCLGYILGKVPIILVYATENLLKYQTSEAIKANSLPYSAIHFLEKKIHEEIIYKLLAEQDPFHKRIDALTTQKGALLDYIDYLILDINADTYKRQKPDILRENQSLETKLAQAKIWKPIAIIISIILIILVFALVSVITPPATDVNKPPPGMLSDIFLFIQLLKI